MSTHSARTIANQANSQHSTGPKTEEGKAKSSLNALTTALTGRTVLLASDDLACYEQHLKAYRLNGNPPPPMKPCWSSPSPIPTGASAASRN